MKRFKKICSLLIDRYWGAEALEGSGSHSLMFHPAENSTYAMIFVLGNKANSQPLCESKSTPLYTE